MWAIQHLVPGCVYVSWGKLALPRKIEYKRMPVKSWDLPLVLHGKSHSLCWKDFCFLGKSGILAAGLEGHLDSSVEAMMRVVNFLVFVAQWAAPVCRAPAIPYSLAPKLCVWLDWRFSYSSEDFRRWGKTSPFISALVIWAVTGPTVPL